MLSWAHGPVASRLWDFDYLNGALIKRRNFVLEGILYHVTFLGEDSSVTLLIQEAGAVRVGSSRHPLLLLSCILNWDRSTGKRRNEGDLWILHLAFQGCPRKAWKSSSLQLPKPTSRALKPQEHLLSLITAQQGALPSFHGWEHTPAWLRECWTSVPRHREWTTALERGTIPSELLEPSPEVSMWLGQHVAQGNFVDDPVRNSPLTPAAL